MNSSFRSVFMWMLFVWTFQNINKYNSIFFILLTFLDGYRAIVWLNLLHKSPHM